MVGLPRSKLFGVTSTGWSVFRGAFAGWFLDSFDLSMMFLLVPTIAAIFFPSGNLTFALIGAFSIYFISLVFRPLGGVIFGHVGDKYGRKTSMVITLIGLGIVIFLTGLLPTYAEAGILAPMVLILLRMITGIFAGGEYGNSSAIMMESTPRKSRGRVGSLLQGGYPMGYTTAAIAFLALRFSYGASGFATEGWRFMFFIGVVPVIIGLAIRLRMPESQLWSDAKKKKHIKKSPIRIVFSRKYIGAFLSGALAMTGIAWLYSLTLGYYPTILPIFTSIAFPTTIYIVIAAILASFAGYFTSGYVSDIIGRKKTIYVFSILGIIFAFPSVYVLFNSSYGAVPIAIMASILAFVTTGIYGVIPAFLSEKFPTEVRDTGVGSSFNSGFIIGSWSSVIALAIAGSSDAFLSSVPKTGTLLLVTAALIIVGEVLLFASAYLSKETYKEDLKKTE